MAAPSIEATDVALAYRMDRNRASTMKEYAVNLFKRQVHRETFWALNGVSFSVNPGETLAVIGPNGAGKSTLMKIIARVLPPTQGRVVVRGRVAAMISLGAGFNPELTARENIILYGTLLGRDTDEMRSRVGPIVEWAELADFIDVPIRSFSSGMTSRLAFSVATDTVSEVLVVDEVLAVGDQSFRKRSKQRMRELITGGSSVLLVSHVMPVIRDMADRVLWLDHGIVKMLGEPSEVIEAYEASLPD